MISSLPDVIFEPFLCLSGLPNTPLVVLKRPRCELGSNCTACAVDCYQQTLSTWPPPDGLSQSERGSGWEGAGGGVGGDQDGEARARWGRVCGGVSIPIPLPGHHGDTQTNKPLNRDDWGLSKLLITLVEGTEIQTVT